MSIKILQPRRVGVDIYMSPDVLRTFFPTADGEILPQLRLLAKGDDWQTLVYPEISPAIQGVVQQIINCPYHGVIKRMYLQAKVLELMTLQLTPILAHQEGLQSLEMSKKLHQQLGIPAKTLIQPYSLAQ
ncbi:hypothetical protein [Nostoc sp.]